MNNSEMKAVMTLFGMVVDQGPDKTVHLLSRSDFNAALTNTKGFTRGNSPRENNLIAEVNDELSCNPAVIELGGIYTLAVFDTSWLLLVKTEGANVWSTKDRDPTVQRLTRQVPRVKGTWTVPSTTFSPVVG